MIELPQRLAQLSPAKRQLMQERLRREPSLAEPIAVVGIGCRFPGAPDLDAFWKLISGAGDAIGEIPPSRWDVDAFYDPTGTVDGKMSTRWGAFLPDVDQFDALFFGIAPREAKKIDPQQRLLLEVAWEALEHAGLAPDRMAGSRTGVFVGIGGTDYSKVPTQYSNYYEHVDAHCGTGNAISIAANRLSYVLDFHGPSIAVDTACSSSLVGVHLAVQSLRSQECDAALAGGVNMILTPETTIAFSRSRMLSPDGCCRPFDAAANGYVRGEGAGIVVLKRLIDAISDGDRILGTIRGTSLNQDGRTSGLTAPNGELQQQVIRRALALAGIPADMITYIEAHGTGTPLGDPIEVDALARTFKRRSQSDATCFLGSVKANIGHLETAAGIASLIKVLLMMQHKQIPPQGHFQKLNPSIRLDGSRLAIADEATPWTSREGPRIAGVSAFGFGGTNSHVVLQEAASSTIATGCSDRPLHLMRLSAKSPTALQALADRCADHLQSTPDSIGDLCHSANVGRATFGHRLTAIGATADSIATNLRSQAKTSLTSSHGPVRTGRRPRTAFLFTGQGSQYEQMGRQLYETQPTFRRTIDQCNEILSDVLDHSLLSVLYPQNGGPSRLDQTVYTQPTLFALEYALASLWRSWGVEPDIALGHSVGEYAAACTAGIFSLEDGIRLIATRSALMQQQPKNGSMAVIFAPLERIADAVHELRETVSVAAVNGPENTVISGLASDVQRLIDRFEKDGLKTQPLTVSHAFHSPLMEPLLDPFRQHATAVDYKPPALPVISNLTGRELGENDLGPEYLCRHIRQPVRFFESVHRLGAMKPDVVLEIGPSATLTAMARRCLPDASITWLNSLRKGRDDWRSMLESLSQLHIEGVPVDWKGFDNDYCRQRVSLPTYPFERQPFWFDPPRNGSASTASGPIVHPLLGRSISTCLEQTLFENGLSGNSPAYLADHEVQGSPVVPAAVYLELGLAAGSVLSDGPAATIENLSVQQALFLSGQDERRVQIAVSPESAGRSTYRIHSRTDPTDAEPPQWSLNACGDIVWERTQADVPNLNLAQIRGRMKDSEQRGGFYGLMRDRGLVYGPKFQVLKDLARGDGEALASVELPQDVAAEQPRYHLHPALLDACFQSIAGVLPTQEDGAYSASTYLPMHVRRLTYFRQPGDELYVYARRVSDANAADSESVESDVVLVDSSGNPIALLEGVRVQRVGRPSGHAKRPAEALLHRVEWHPQSISHSPGATNGHPAVNKNRSLQGARFLLFKDRQGVGDALIDRLQEAGAKCLVVTVRNSATNRLSADAAIEVDNNTLHSDDAYRRIMNRCGEVAPNSPWQVIHLWSLDLPADDESQDGSFEQLYSHGCGSGQRLLQHLARAGAPRTDSVWLVTRGAQSLPETTTTRFEQAPTWGLGRVAALEHPGLGCRLVDLDPDTDHATQAASLATEFAANDGEDQIGFRRGKRYVARLCPGGPAFAAKSASTRQAILPGAPFQLSLGSAGELDSLDYRSVKRRELETGQIELSVHATGLNFSDVLKGMGLYPGITDDVVPLGIEASGVVTAVGEGVTRFQAGDEVMGVVPYSLASHAVTTEYAIVPKPISLDFAQASTVPITFLTAFYGLRRLARLRSGESVLIHAGAGGVGLAAIQIAQETGAEIFATAGSDRKRDFLRNLGVHHVLDSRTLQFADQIKEITDRRGVDVVLNSLPGEAMAKSLASLASYGRFLEIGKTDIYQNRMIGLLPFQDNLSYFAIDLDRMLRQRPEEIRDLYDELMPYFHKERFRPLPMTVFPAEETVSAFRYMAQRKNIGKVVVSFESDDAPSKPTGPIKAEATYLISGGRGALGRHFARWLVDHGAQNLVLLSRRPTGGPTEPWIRELEATGARVLTVSCDISDDKGLTAALKSLPEEFPPLKGVIHAAGLLDDGLLLDMSEERLRKVMVPKAQGAWNLHRAVGGTPLDFFVMFSSLAAVIGSPGQSNYAAANAYLDALADHRRNKGLPAHSIQWGPWSGAGMASENERSQQASSRAVRPLAVDAALHAFQQILEGNETAVTVVDADWPMLKRQLPGRTTPSMLRDLAEDPDESRDEQSEQTHSIRRSELLAAEPAERKQMLHDDFQTELSRITGIDVEKLDIEQPLGTLGLDSLMALELKNKIEHQLSIEIPMARFLEGPSIRTLADDAAKLLAVDVADATTTDSSNGKASHADGNEDWSPIVVLKQAGQAWPLFCIHPLGGDVRCYDGLARAIATDRPLYALRARGTHEEIPPHETIDQMVEDYIAALRKLQPRGPYFLAGWSTGGIYAHAIAERLVHEGDSIAPLVFFDTPLPSICDDVDVADDARFLSDLVEFTNHFSGSNMQIGYEELSRLTSGQRFQAMLREAKRQHVVPEDVGEQHIRRLVDVAKANVKVLKEYRPQPIDQPLFLFRPQQKGLLEQRLSVDVSNDLGWQEVASTVHVERVPGDHFSMMIGDNAGALADILARRLDPRDRQRNES